MSVITTERYQLGPVNSIPPGEGRNFRLAGGREIAVFRTRADELYATQSRCPHRGAPLADGLVGGGQVVCPFHGYAFELATGEPRMNPCPAITTFPIEVDENGMMYVGMTSDDESQEPCIR